MKPRIAALLIFDVAALLQAPETSGQTNRGNRALVAHVTAGFAAQAMNPPYLSEMPAADRVMREIQGTDPADTAIRQIGAFWQLTEIIKDMAWGLGHRFYGTKGQLLPDEERIWADYGAAYSRIWQSRPELKSQSDFIAALHGYDVNPKLRAELLERFFSQNFRTQYYKANAKAEAEYRAWVQSRSDEAARVQAQNRAPAQANTHGTGLPPTDDPGTLAARRCVAAGRDPIECMKEALGKTFGEIVPGAKKTSLPSGLRLNGVYPGSGGLNLTFGPAAAAVTCGQLKPEGHTYSVATKGNQVLVTIQNDPKPIVVAFRSDGKLAGPGPTDIKGRIVVGSRTEQTTGRKSIAEYEARQYNPLDVHRDMAGNLYVNAPVSTTVPVYEPRTERCNVGVLASTGAANPVGLDTLLGTKIFDATARQMASSEEIKATPGLRMTGVYSGQGGFSIEFHNESAVLECRDAVVARAYAVDNTGSRVTIQHSPNPIVLALRPDGTLTGSGPIQVAGRVVVGMSADNHVLYAPKTDTCTLGILTPDSPGSANTTTSSQPGAPSGPSGTGGTSAPAKPSSAAGSATLTMTLGIPSRPGQVLRPGQVFILMNENFETALKQQGFEPSSGSSILKSAFVCNTATPNCQKVTATVKAHSVGVVRVDPEGKATFPGVAAGTYFLVSRVEYPAFSERFLVFNLRVDLKPGANSVTVDQQNAAPIN